MQEFKQELSQIEIPKDVLTMLTDNLMSTNSVMPVKYDMERKCLTVVTCKIENFTDIPVLLDLIRSQSSYHISKLELFSVDEDNFHAGIKKHFSSNVSIAASQADFKEEVAQITSEQQQLVDAIFSFALKQRASDIHITPLQQGSLLQYRVDGRLISPDLRSMPGLRINEGDKFAVINIIKQRCQPSLDVSNSRVPQDGSMSKGGLDYRINTLPTSRYGEKVNIRIFDPTKSISSLKDIGFNEKDEDKLRELKDRAAGIIIMTGVTGAGKSTTLNACLKEIDLNERIVISLEDPVEQVMPGISQVQIREVEGNEDVNLNFPKALRAALRQDPNILLIQEIRDEDTAQIAVKASQTGHLILTTLHTRNSIEAIERLEGLNMRRSYFLNQIICLMAQRLVPKICPHCASEYKISDNVLRKLRDVDRTYLNGKKLLKGTGCDKCVDGVRGRVPVLEMIVFNNNLRDFFTKQRGIEESEKYLRKNIPGYKTLWEKGMDLVAEGKICIEDLLADIDPDEKIEGVKYFDTKN